MKTSFYNYPNAGKLSAFTFYSYHHCTLVIVTTPLGEFASKVELYKKVIAAAAVASVFTKNAPDKLAVGEVNNAEALEI